MSVWELCGKRGRSYELKKNQTYEKESKEANWQNVLFIMLFQIVLVRRWLILENILYCTHSEYTPKIIAKGKFGEYGIVWLWKVENYNQGRVKNS